MKRARPLETPNGPERTDLPYEFEICDFLDSVDSTIRCPEFPFTIWTEHPENLHEFPSIRYHLASGHVIDGSCVTYRLHPFGRTWIEYFIGLPKRIRVDITVRLLDSNTSEAI